MDYARNFNSILNKQKNCYLLSFEQQTKKMENYFHKNKSSFVVKTFKHFIHKYKSWEKGWIQCDLNIPRDLLRSKGQRRVLFPQTETCISLNHLCSTKRNKYAYLRSHLKEKKKPPRPKVTFKCPIIQKSCFILLKLAHLKKKKVPWI